MNSVFDKGIFCVTITLIDGVSILFRLILGDSFWWLFGIATYAI